MVLINIKDLENIVGSTIINKNNNRLHYIEKIIIYKYKDLNHDTIHPLRYRVLDSEEKAIMNGTEEEVLKQLLNFEVIR